MAFDPQPEPHGDPQPEPLRADTDKSWLRRPLTDSADIAKYYDGWAETYEAELVGEWRYDAPVEVARRLRAMGVSTPVLDIGCGIGLTGRALRAEGFAEIDGLDLSEASLAAAKTGGNYRSLQRHDFNEAPLPFPVASFASAVCVGVLSYAWDPRALVLEMARVVAPGGAICFTHRSDLWDEQTFDAVLTKLVEDGQLTNVDWSEPRPYMPGNEDFTDQIGVRYVTGRVPDPSTTARVH